VGWTGRVSREVVGRTTAGAVGSILASAVEVVDADTVD
jgi:hypothetical protein